MSVTIHAIDSARDRRDFLNLPRAIYAQDAAWVEPLRLELKQRLHPQKNPFFRHGEAALFVARRNHEVVGRISAQIDHVAHPGEAPGEGNFGFYEAVADDDVARALFGAASDWLQQRRCRKIVGPYNFRLEDPAPGFLLKGYEHRPSFMMSYSKPYYAAQAERCGLAPVMQLNAYGLTKDEPVPTAILDRVAEARQIPHLRVRAIDMAHAYEEAETMRGIFNASLKDNWGFVPMTEKQVRAMVRDLKRIADPRIILFAEVDQRPIGVLINLPNLNDILYDCRGRLFPKGLYRLAFQRRRIRSLRGYAIAIAPEYQRHGIAAVLIDETYRRGLAVGYESAEITWILGANAGMNELAKAFGGTPLKQYALMGKTL